MQSPPPPSGDARSQHFGRFCRHAAGLCSALALVGCSPDSLNYTDTDVVITVRDLGRSYAPYKTFALPDTVIDVCDLPESGVAGAAGAAGAGGAESDRDCEPLNHTHDDEVLKSIRDNLDELGFDKVDPDDAPDVTILVAGVAQEDWYVYDGYCDYWYGYCFEYGWSPTAVSYPVGTLAMYMVASSEANDQAGSVPVIWLGVVSGILSGSSDLDQDRIEHSIDQAFSQSSYLGEGK